MRIWVNTKKNAMLMIRRIERDGVLFKMVGREEIHIVPVPSLTRQKPYKIARRASKSNYASARRVVSDPNPDGYYLVLPDPISPQHAQHILRWARNQPGGKAPGDVEFAMSFQGGARVANPLRPHEGLDPEVRFKLAEKYAKRFNCRKWQALHAESRSTQKQ
jgi:hypothetical protein